MQKTTLKYALLAAIPATLVTSAWAQQNFAVYTDSSSESAWQLTDPVNETLQPTVKAINSSAIGFVVRDLATNSEVSIKLRVSGTKKYYTVVPATPGDLNSVPLLTVYDVTSFSFPKTTSPYYVFSAVDAFTKTTIAGKEENIKGLSKPIAFKLSQKTLTLPPTLTGSGIRLASQEVLVPDKSVLPAPGTSAAHATTRAATARTQTLSTGLTDLVNKAGSITFGEKTYNQSEVGFALAQVITYLETKGYRPDPLTAPADPARAANPRTFMGQTGYAVYNFSASSKGTRFFQANAGVPSYQTLNQGFKLLAIRNLATGDQAGILLMTIEGFKFYFAVPTYIPAYDSVEVLRYPGTTGKYQLELSHSNDRDETSTEHITGYVGGLQKAVTLKIPAMVLNVPTSMSGSETGLSIDQNDHLIADDAGSPAGTSITHSTTTLGYTLNTTLTGYANQYATNDADAYNVMLNYLRSIGYYDAIELLGGG